MSVFREVRRVLRDDGVLWLNLGDSYCADVRKGRAHMGEGKNSAHNVWFNRQPLALKPKDLIGIPWRVAFALQADGWWLRSDIIWAKSNPMPESVTDRPTRSHEYVFLLTKSERYFYDVDAIREPSVMKPQRRPNGRPADETPRVNGTKQAWPTAQRDEPGVDGNPAGRNARSVWNITTQPYKGAHFAVMPEELVRRCILAGTSADGCCVRCGTPRKRVTERTPMVVRPGPTREAQRDAAANGGKRTNFSGTMLEPATTTTTGWTTGCACEGAGVVPCVVLDPFMGSGTVGKVAAELGRQWLGVELQPDYAPLIVARTETP